MSDEETVDVLRVLDELRRLHATNQIDVIAVVAIGPDPETNLAFMGTDIQRPGDAVRLIGTSKVLQDSISSGAYAEHGPVPRPGPRGIVPDE